MSPHWRTYWKMMGYTAGFLAVGLGTMLLLAMAFAAGQFWLAPMAVIVVAVAVDLYRRAAKRADAGAVA